MAGYIPGLIQETVGMYINLSSRSFFSVLSVVAFLFIFNTSFADTYQYQLGAWKSTSGTGTAVSSFTPSEYTPGQAVAVVITVTPQSDVSSQAVEDGVPAGWVVSAISDSGSFDAINNKVKWGPYFDDTARVFSYTITPPGDASGMQTFSGSASFDGTGVAISGDRQIDKASTSGTGTAVSSFTPSEYTPGQAVAVAITVTPESGVSSQAVEDGVPAGWVVSAISDSGSFDAINNKVKWGPYFDDTVRVLSYTITPPGDASGMQTFSGSASFDGTGVAISGDRQISASNQELDTIFKDSFESE